MPSADDALIAAVERSDANAVKAALADGAKPDTVKPGGRAVLLMALLARSKRIATLLLDAGASVRVSDRRKSGPLHVIATDFPDLGLAERLIDAGAELDGRGGDDGRTPLHEAALSGRLQLAGVLVKRGADLNAKTTGGDTALALVLGEANKVGLKTAHWLVEHGASVLDVDGDGSNALHAAAHGGYKEVDFFELAFAKGARPVPNRRGMTPLHFACWTTSGRPTAVWDFLLERGADLNAQNDAGETALHSAASYWNTFAVKYLLGRGANATLKNHDGLDVLAAAQKLKQTKIIAILERALE